MLEMTSYDGESTVGPSSSIWRHIPKSTLVGRDGFHFFDDFKSFRRAVPATADVYVGDSGGWLSYEDSGAAIAQIETEVGGVIKITTDGTDNDEAWLQPGSATSVLGKITSLDSEKFAFEARVRFPQIVTQNIFVGLSEEGLAVADTITDADVFITTKDMIGFHVAPAASSTMTFTYQKASQTKQTIISSLQTLVADTWYKFGFLYTSAGPNTKRIRVYVNGVEQATWVTATQLAAATFPSGEELNILLGVKNNTTAAVRMDCDWVRCAGTGGR